jgi:hypothetical protein
MVREKVNENIAEECYPTVTFAMTAKERFSGRTFGQQGQYDHGEQTRRRKFHFGRTVFVYELEVDKIKLSRGMDTVADL